MKTLQIFVSGWWPSKKQLKMHAIQVQNAVSKTLWPSHRSLLWTFIKTLKSNLFSNICLLHAGYIMYGMEEKILSDDKFSTLWKCCIKISFYSKDMGFLFSRVVIVDMKYCVVYRFWMHDRLNVIYFESPLRKISRSVVALTVCKAFGALQFIASIR